jgi:ferredoxin
MSLKVTVDLDLCQAHGDCVMAAPEVFDIGDDDDVVSVLNSEPGEDLRAKVERAASDCPVSAITIEG